MPRRLLMWLVTLGVVAVIAMAAGFLTFGGADMGQ